MAAFALKTKKTTSVPHIQPLPPVGNKEVLEAAAATGKLGVLRSYSTKVITERESPAEGVYDLHCHKATKAPETPGI